MNIKHKVVEIVQKCTENDIDISEMENLMETGIIDSMQVMEVILMLEEAFGIEFVEDDLIIENFSSVRNIEHMVENKKNEKNSDFSR